MIFKLLTEQHLEFLSLNGGCTGLSEPTLVKMPHCWKSHVTAHLVWTKNEIASGHNNESDLGELELNFKIFVIQRLKNQHCLLCFSLTNKWIFTKQLFMEKE